MSPKLRFLVGSCGGCLIGCPLVISLEFGRECAMKVVLMLILAHILAFWTGFVARAEVDL